MEKSDSEYDFELQEFHPGLVIISDQPFVASFVELDYGSGVNDGDGDEGDAENGDDTGGTDPGCQLFVLYLLAGGSRGDKF
mmetsp:Transcript_94034/g.157909  ORF Transcript_94034/g.157909 Transcript_94034/m.157909 type:complete len:81 (-) Transcript_94034:30-272(-)